MEKRVWEGYELTYGNCQEYRVENYNVDKGIVDAQKTRKDIDRLGNVNKNAIVELEEQEVRYNELNTQVTDLVRAEKETSEIINQLTKEMETKFNNEFAIISINCKCRNVLQY